MGRWWILGLAVAAFTAACASGGEKEPATTQPTSLDGSVTLQPEDSIALIAGYFSGQTSCDGASSLMGRDGRVRTFFGRPASEVAAGTSVTVTDDKGQTIGVGRVDAGRWIEYPTNTNLTGHKCEMKFSVQLSRASPFYGVQIGNQPGQQYAKNTPITLTFRGTGTLAV